MATYKVPQDVEAEDKLLGPFTFKQFIFLIGFALSAFIMYQLGRVNFFLTIPLIPVVALFGLLGLYRPKDQPIENKMLAYVNYYFKPHKRIWSRDGIVEHVHIRAPKFVQKNFTDNRSQAQVHSQLQQLAQIVDTRGWSTKRAEIQSPNNLASNGASSDRLVQPSDLTRYNQDPIDIHDSDDVYSRGNPVTDSFEELSEAASNQARQAALARMQEARDAPPSPQHVTATSVKPDPALKSTQAPLSDNLTVGNPTQNNLHYEPFPHMRQRTIDPSGRPPQDSPDSLPMTADNDAQPEPPKQAAPDEDRVRRLKELSTSELPISSVAQRAKEDDSQEQVLNISH